jgi:hypothetical protein
MMLVRGDEPIDAGQGDQAGDGLHPASILTTIQL